MSTEKEKWNTKEFFESDVRSSHLRRTSIEILQIVDNLLSGKTPPNERPPAYSRLEQLNGELIGLGITTQMHVGQTEEDFKKNPVATAEYIADQAIQFTGEDMQTALELHPLLGEWSEEVLGVDKETSAHLQPDSVPKHIAEFRTRLGIVGMLAVMLDATDDVK